MRALFNSFGFGGDRIDREKRSLYRKAAKARMALLNSLQEAPHFTAMTSLR